MLHSFCTISIVLAGADVDDVVAGVGVHQEDAGVGAVVGVEEFSSGGAGAPG